MGGGGGGFNQPPPITAFSPPFPPQILPTKGSEFLPFLQLLVERVTALPVGGSALLPAGWQYGLEVPTPSQKARKDAHSHYF